MTSFEVLKYCRKSYEISRNQQCPHGVVRRGDAVRALPPHPRSLADLTFEVGDLRLSVSDYRANRRTAGLLILKDGEIGLELRHEQRPGEPSDGLLDGEVDDLDARRRRAPLGYGYHWWALPHVPTGIHAGAFLASGSFGKCIFRPRR